MSNAINFVDDLIHGALKGGTVNDFLDKYKMNWEVEKSPLLTPDGVTAPSIALQRSDNRAILGVMAGSYEPFQNRELADLMHTLSQRTGMDMAVGTTFNGGAKVAIQLKSDDLTGIGNNKDTVKSFITTINSFDGSTSLAFGATNITISCRNTFFAAYSKMESRFRHSRNMRDRIDQALRSIEAVRYQEQSMFDQFMKMAEVKATPTQIRNIVQELLDVDTSKKLVDLQEVHSQQKLNQVTGLLNSIKGEMAQKGDTLWGLFSGVTHYTTHTKSGYNRDNGVLESKLFGTSQDLDATAYKLTSLMTLN